MSGGKADHAAGRGGRSREPLRRADRIVITLLAAQLGVWLAGLVAISYQFGQIEREIHDFRMELREFSSGAGREDTLPEAEDNPSARDD